jgi:hypothetical protein
MKGCEAHMLFFPLRFICQILESLIEDIEGDLEKCTESRDSTSWNG